MDFIERIFHMSPDHGNGAFEALMLFAILAVPIAWAVVRAASAVGKKAHLRVMVWRLRLGKNVGKRTAVTP